MTTRRNLLTAGGLLVFLDATGAELLLSPAEARKSAVPFAILSPDEAATLEVFGDAMVPGAAAAGIAHFVDAHLKAAPADSLLMLRYLDVPPPWDAFYKAGLAALDQQARRLHGVAFAALDGARRLELSRAIAATPPLDWRGPPAPLFQFAVRADAVDMVYGTPAGFAALGVDYLEHILPERAW